MTNKSNYPLSRLSSEEFEEGAKIALKNSFEKFEVSKMIYNKAPATSVSILITSLEELAKALYLKVLSHDPKKVYIEQLEKIFYKHERKHEAIGAMYSGLILRKNAHRSAKEIAIMLVGIGVLFAGLLIYKSVKDMKKRIPGNGERNLEFARKRGLYLDLDKETGEWISNDL